MIVEARADGTGGERGEERTTFLPAETDGGGDVYAEEAAALEALGDVLVDALWLLDAGDGEGD